MLLKRTYFLTVIGGVFGPRIVGLNHVSVVTIDWCEIWSSYNIPDTAVRDKRQK